MARSKKTRKVGSTAPKLAPRSKKSERVVARKKQNSGNKAGSRQAPAKVSHQSGTKKDPMHGSKKPVQLNITSSQPNINAPKSTKKIKLTDEQQLLQLEDDPRLNQLLDQLEEGKDLNTSDQQWLDQQLSKIEHLMEKLNITELDEYTAPPTKAASDDDLFDQFESGSELLKQYQD